MSRNEIKSKVFKYLARREHSRKELFDKLERKDYEPAEINYVLNELTDKGYIDDTRFAETWIRHRLERKPRGPHLIRAELKNKGVDPDIRDKLLAKLMPPRKEFEVALGLAESWLAKRTISDSEEENFELRKKLFRYLSQKGFHRSTAKKIAIELNLS